MMILAFCDKQYPDQQAFAFLQHLQASLSSRCPELKVPANAQTVNEINENAKLIVMEIHSKYKDPSKVSKTVVARQSIDKATGVMKDNLSKMFSNQSKFNEIEKKSFDLQMSAEAFRSQSRRLEQMAKWRQRKQ